MRARGYSIFACSPQQDILLEKMRACAQPGTVGVFDLDGCVFDTRLRQVVIFREFSSRYDVPILYFVEAKHFVDWNLKTPLRTVGMTEEAIDQIYDTLYAFWWKRFFHSDYVRMDHALPGAVRFVNQCYKQGMDIVYLTGRDHRTRPGTEAGLLAYGFPYSKERTVLITKPEFSMEDTAYKTRALSQIRTIGKPVLFIDNEPSNINAFHSEEPDALSIFIETDHSPRNITPHPEIPWLRSFCMRSWHGENWTKFEEAPYCPTA